MKKLALAFVIFAFAGFAQARDHWDVRLAISKLQVLTVGTGGVLMIGDSITEQFWWTTIAGQRIVNAGQGGAGIDEAIIVADEMLPVAKPKVVALMIGVNDCVRGAEANPTAWGVKYRMLLAKIHAAGAVPVPVNILPVEQNPALGLGVNYFNTDCIAALNSQWYSAIIDRGEMYVNFNYVFAVAPAYRYMQPGWTADGVHLNGVGSRQFYYQLEPAITSALQRNP